MKLIYLDTNIWIDFWENRSDGLRPLGEFAFNVLKRAYNCEFKVVVSSILMAELKFNYGAETVMEMLKDLRRSKKHIYIYADKEHNKSALEYSKKTGIGFNDCLHAVLAKARGCDCLVTQNMKHFERLEFLIKPKFPGDL
ncbi:MAG: PIN domain-containing protein [Candidatus Diapherotrites archaeon]